MNRKWKISEADSWRCVVREGFLQYDTRWETWWGLDYRTFGWICQSTPPIDHLFYLIWLFIVDWQKKKKRKQMEATLNSARNQIVKKYIIKRFLLEGRWGRRSFSALSGWAGCDGRLAVIAISGSHGGRSKADVCAPATAVGRSWRRFHVLFEAFVFVIGAKLVLDNNGRFGHLLQVNVLQNKTRNNWSLDAISCTYTPIKPSSLGAPMYKTLEKDVGFL